MAKISPKIIAEAIYRAGEGKHKAELDVVLKNAVKLLVSKKMLSSSDLVLQSLQDIIDKKNKVVRAKISSAKHLKKEDKDQLEEEIKKKYHAESVESVFFENEELLGGVRIEVKDEVIDTTYRNRLNQLEKFLITSK